MNVLILGSQGMLGGEFKSIFSRALGWGRQELDLGQIDDLQNRIAALPEKPEVVINCAAYNNVDEAEKNKQQAMLINSEAVGQIARACENLGIVLVNFSTNYVFDGQKGQYDEADAPNPLSVYGQSKYQGELLLQANSSKYYLVRTAVLFGRAGQSQFAKKSFIELMLEMAAKTGTINAIEDEINSLTYAADLAGAVEQLITENYPYGIYHIVNSGEASWYDFAKEIFAVSGIQANLVGVPSAQLPRPAERPKKAVLLNSKFPPLRPWREALAEFLKS